MSGTDYQNHASRMQAAATAAHKDWVTSLTREQRENLKRLKVLDQDEDSSEVGGHSPLQSADMADSSLARVEPDFAANGLGSQAEFAHSIGVSRTIVSKSVKAWQRQLNLRPSNFQKSEEACATYSTVAK